MVPYVFLCIYWDTFFFPDKQPVRLAYQPALIQPEQCFSLTTNQPAVLSAISQPCFSAQANRVKII
jgi:hypothetical protein